MRHIFFLMVTSLFLTLPFSNSIAETENTQVVIQDFSAILLNEVDLTAEFLEIRNSGEEAIDVNTFQFSELSAGNEKRHNFSDSTDELILEPEEFLLLNMSRLLNNTGETIRIYSSVENDNPLQEVEVLDPETGKSFSRDTNGIFHWGVPTPGAENIFDMPELPPDPEEPPNPANEEYIHILLNEVDLHAEFLEIFNSGETAIDLSAFEFSELSGTTEKRHLFQNFASDLVLNPGEFLLLEMSSKLNNTGEEVQIYTHSNSTIPLQTVLVPKLDEGTSYARNTAGEFQSTLGPTPGDKNSIQVPPTSSGGSKKPSSRGKTAQDFFKIVSEAKSLSHERVVLQISEVAFKDSRHDTIEIFCAGCGKNEETIDLKGFRIFDDKVFFEFPPETFVTTGDYLILELKAGEERVQKMPYGWKFFLTKSGLTGTDENLMIIDSAGFVEDGLCWTDHNGKFSPGEKEDIGYMRARREWLQGQQNRENECFPSQSIASGISVARRNAQDTNTSHDFFPTNTSTFGEPNSDPLPNSEETDIVFSSVLFLPEHNMTLLKIQNRGDQETSLEGFYLYRTGKKKESFSDISLNPHQETTVMLKNISASLLLELQDAWGNTEDFVCFHSLKTPFDIEEIDILRTQYIKEQWSSLKTEDCILSDFADGILKRGQQDTNSAADFLFSPFTKLEMKNFSPIQITGVEPNPKGEDSQNEWLEITTIEDILQLNDWILLIGDDTFFLPDMSLASGQTLRFTAEDGLPVLRNTDGQIHLLSPEGVLHEIHWKSAKEGAVLRANAGELFWDEVTSQDTVWKAPIFEITSTPITELEIVSVLPNPKGKDVGNETISIKNISGESGIIENLQFSNGKTSKEILRIFLEKDEIRTFVGKKMVPTLKNTAGEIFLTDVSQNVMDSLSWVKARDGEIFGKSGSLRPPTIKKKKTSLKKSSSKRSSSPKEDIIITGILKSFSETSLFITPSDGSIQEFFFDAKNPQHIFLLSQVLQIGEPIELWLSDTYTILDVNTTWQTPFLLASLSPALSRSPKLLNNSLFLFLMLCSGIGATLSMIFIFLRRQESIEGK